MRNFFIMIHEIMKIKLSNFENNFMYEEEVKKGFLSTHNKDVN